MDTNSYPRVPELLELLNELEPVSNLHNFALHLPGLRETQIHIVEKDYRWLEDQSRAVYKKWLEAYPDGTWKDIVQALKKSGNNSLAAKIAEKRKIELSPMHNSTRIQVQTHTQTAHSSQVLVSQATITAQPVEIPLEELVKERLLKLHDRFSDLVTDVIEELNKLYHNGSIKLLTVATYTQEYLLLPNEVKLTTSKDIEHLFDQIRPYYDFLECEIIEKLAQRFIIERHIVVSMQLHVAEALEFTSSTPIEELMKTLDKVVEKIPTEANRFLSPIHIKITSPWKKRPVECLYKLIKFLISQSHPSLSLFKHNITIRRGSISIDYVILRSCAEAVVSHAQQKSYLMKYIGVFVLTIGETVVLQEEENVKFSFDESLLEASENGKETAVDFLLDIGANVNYGNDDKTTPVMISSEAGYRRIVEMLLENGADSNLQNEKGWTALIGASGNGHDEIVDLLLKSNANPNLQMGGGWTALMGACRRGQYHISKQLLVHGADPNIQTKKGWSALMAASKNGYLEIVELLLQYNADPNAQNRNGWTALMSASEKGHYHTVKQLLSTNVVDPNAQTEKGWSALMAASEHGHLKVAELLILHGATPNLETENGWTALTAAAEKGHYEVAKLLLEKGADPNIHHINGSTPLMVASLHGHYEVAKLLLEHNADPDIWYLNGTSALTIARQNEHSKVVELLHQYGADERVIGSGMNG